MYKVATAAILIQTRGVQSVFSLESFKFDQTLFIDTKWFKKKHSEFTRGENVYILDHFIDQLLKEPKSRQLSLDTLHF